MTDEQSKDYKIWAFLRRRLRENSFKGFGPAVEAAKEFEDGLIKLKSMATEEQPDTDPDSKAEDS